MPHGNELLPDHNFEEEDDTDFIPCDKCDGHPACEDFGCAFKLGKGNMVNKPDMDL